jgi:hypothetical protein
VNFVAFCPGKVTLKLDRVFRLREKTAGCDVFDPTIKTVSPLTARAEREYVEGTDSVRF